jgi:hypothetical protein
MDDKIIATKTRRYLKKGSYLIVKEQQKREPRTFQIQKGILHPNGLLTYVCSISNCECSSVGCTYLVKL